MKPEPHAQAALSPHRRITASEVRHLCGGVSDMTLWRWLNEKGSTFPQPCYIGRRRYWREAEVIEWLDQRQRAAGGAAA